MRHPSQNIVLVLDDRESTSDEVRSLVGHRRYGSIILKRQALSDRFKAALPAWCATRLFHLRNADDLPALRASLESSGHDTVLCVVAGRAGFSDPERLRQLCERIPYAEEDFTDRLYKPLLVFMRDPHRLVEQWGAFCAAPLHQWGQAWQSSQRLQSLQPLDLANIRDFLTFMHGATPARHFNALSADAQYFTKSSADRDKMRAEYTFYQLVPESMQSWLVQPFDFREDRNGASYRMLRYYLADAALQWVHGAFDAESFEAFIERLLFVLNERPRRPCTKAASGAAARTLFVDKLAARCAQFLDSAEGKRINMLAASASPELDLERQLARFRGLYERHARGFESDYMAVGHGDPCFSNILYDQQRYLLKLIDPKGATTEADLWTHPLYDICKVSHSVLGDYDFINSGLYRVGFTDSNDLLLHLEHTNHPALKQQFLRQLRKLGIDPRVVRLGEASLFLSMLPLHSDHPNKVMAFMLRARQILDEVEHDKAS